MGSNITMPSYTWANDLWFSWGDKKYMCNICGTWFSSSNSECDYCGTDYSGDIEREEDCM